MPSDVRMTMIGYTGSGKTTYLVGMYHQMQVGFHGFTMRTQDLDDRGLEELYTRLAAGGKNRWPPQTGPVFEEHKFDLEYKSDLLASLDWVDYQGGRIDELYQAPHVQELLNRLVGSTCILLAVSGEHLAERLTIGRATKDIRVQRINDLMSQVVKQVHPSKEKPLPVAIVITKYDYCIAKGRNEKEIFGDIQSLFSPLFAKSGLFSFRSPSYLTAICPVTLGRDLATNIDDGVVNPQYMQHPIFFAAWATLRQKLSDLKSTDAGAVQREELEQKIALLQDRIKGVPIFQDGQAF